MSIVGEERISRGIEFQMTGAEQRKERELNLMLDGVGKKLVLVRGAMKTDMLVVMDKGSKVLRRVG